MTLPLYVVDAFTSEPFRGNPAGVVLLDEPRRDDWMQAVAAEMKHSETAFVAARADGSFDLRWFTPQTEVDLCGHATLASAHTLWESGRLAPNAVAIFHTRSGELRAARTERGIELDFPVEAPVPTATPAGLLPALGVAPDAAAGAGAAWRAGDFYVLLELVDVATVRALAPDFAALRAVDDVRAVIVTARADAHSEFDIGSRCFAPRVGIDEDPVTGSAHCVLAAYWCPRLGRNELHAVQLSPRGGVLHVRLAGERALIAGHATTVVEGALAV